MSLILTERELEASRKLQEQLAGMTAEEALNALAHARGTVGLQRSEKANAITFHPKDAGSP